MSLVRTLRRFIGTRAASTVTAPQPTPVAPAAPAAEAAPTIDELRQRAKRVYKEVSRSSVCLSVQCIPLGVARRYLLRLGVICCVFALPVVSVSTADLQLHRLGRDYPDENYNFNMRLRRAFESE